MGLAKSCLAVGIYKEEAKHRQSDGVAGLRRGFPRVWARLRVQRARMRRMIGTSGGTGETKGLFGINFHAGGCSVSGESCV